MSKRFSNKGLRALGAGALAAVACAAAGAGAAVAATTTTSPARTTTSPAQTTTSPAQTTTSPAKTTTSPQPTGSAQPAGLYITGAGYGHGIGMSQYGAAGFALHGYSYSHILAHYYQDTTLADVGQGRKIRVLLKQGAAAFTGADTRLGPKTKLDPDRTYSVFPHKGGLLLMSGGKGYGVWPAPLTVGGRPGPVTVPGMGEYNGQLEFMPPAKGGGLDTINTVDIEDYLRGVVPSEMPSTWPTQALEAQAVAARSYAIADSSSSSLFNVYDDTRSQVYGGVKAETPASDAAVAATDGKVVEYAGQPAITYFFSSSGGYTESIQNVWVGVTPEAWLRGVPDPYDDSFGNPYYRWKDKISVATATRKLHRYVKGSLTGIKILQRGVSPRVVKAEVIGTKGATDVSGTTLQKAFGLRSTYMSFKTITRHKVVSSGSGTSSGSSGSATTPATGSGASGSATTPAAGSATSGNTGVSGLGPGKGTTTKSSTSTTSGSTSPGAAPAPPPPAPTHAGP